MSERELDVKKALVMGQWRMRQMRLMGLMGHMRIVHTDIRPMGLIRPIRPILHRAILGACLYTPGSQYSPRRAFQHSPLAWPYAGAWACRRADRRAHSLVLTALARPEPQALRESCVRGCPRP